MNLSSHLKSAAKVQKNDYKFYDFVNDPCVNFHRVRVNQYELTLQKDIVGRMKIMFTIFNNF